MLKYWKQHKVEVISHYYFHIIQLFITELIKKRQVQVTVDQHLYYIMNKHLFTLLKKLKRTDFFNKF